MKPMTKEELKKLQEITGLLTEEQVDEIKAEQEKAAAEYEAEAKEMAEYWTGMFVEAFGHLGMIDEVCICPDGVYLGFVWATPNEWVGRLATIEDVKVLDKEPQIRAAKKSAALYFVLEKSSLSRYIERYAKEGKDTKDLERRMQNINKWLFKLG